MLKRGLILILFLGIFLVSLNNVSAVISCGSQTYPDGTGNCCDQGNGANGVWFRGDYYNSCPSTAGNYRYVSNSGNDANDGLTPATAWRTMEKFTNMLTAGQTGIIMGGNWNEQTRDSGGSLKICENVAVTMYLSNSGTSGNPIVVKGHPDYTRPNITANGFNSVFPISVRCSDGHCLHRPFCTGGLSWHVYDYLEFSESYMGLRGEPMSYMIFQDIKIHDTYGSNGNNPAGMLIGYGSPSNNITVRGSEIYRIWLEESEGDGWVPFMGGTNDAGIIVYRTQNLTIENNTFHDMNEGISLKNAASKSIVRRNKFYDISIPIRQACATWDVASDAPNQRYGGDNDIYENVIYNTGTGLRSGTLGVHFVPGGNGGECNFPSGARMRNVRTFNNVMYNTPGAGIWIKNVIAGGSGPDYFENLSFYNNIMVNLGLIDGENLLFQDGGSYLPGFKSDNNILYDAPSYGDGSEVVKWISSWYTLAQYQSVSGWDLNSKQVDPMFLSTNPNSPDFLRPAPGSPAIDAGVKVQGYHCDTSGGTTPAGCKVWYGANPDIGAYEYNPGLPTINCTTVDVNDDLKVNIIDLSLVSFNQGLSLTNRGHLDINSDGSINSADVNEVKTRIGQSC